jgi:hypothetical protein
MQGESHWLFESLWPHPKTAKAAQLGCGVIACNSTPLHQHQQQQQVSSRLARSWPSDAGAAHLHYICFYSNPPSQNPSTTAFAYLWELTCAKGNAGCEAYVESWHGVFSFRHVKERIKSRRPSQAVAATPTKTMHMHEPTAACTCI